MGSNNSQYGADLPSFKDGRGRSVWSRSFANPMLYGLLKAYARENRKNMTEAENILLRFIRKEALGATFFRQFIIGEYIVDFVCLNAHLIIEVDGGYHSEPRQQEDDKVRQHRLESQGFTIIRFCNEEILCNIEQTLTKIKSYINV